MHIGRLQWPPLLLMLPLLSWYAGCRSDSPESRHSFFAGRTLHLLVPYATGGGTDLQARFIAPFLEKHIEGHPSVQVVNVPGADGVIGLNQFALREPADGEHGVFATGATSLLYLLREPGVRYDLRRLVPVAALSGGDVYYISPELGVQQAADLSRLRGRLRLAAAMPVGGDTAALLALDLLGIEAQVIMGYEGKGRTRVAFEQGESNFDHQSTAGFLVNVAPLVERGEAVPLFTAGLMKGGKLVRDPVFPQLPTVEEVYSEMHARGPSGSEWEAYLSVAATVNTMQKVLLFHDRAPPEALAAVKDAVEKIAVDPHFLRDGAKINGEYPLIRGKELDDQFRALLDTPAEVHDWLLQFLVRRYGVAPR